MRLPSRRLMGRVALALVALVALGLLVAHTAIVRDPLWSWAQQQLSSRFHLQLSADRFRYNALTRRVSLENVRLAAEGHEDAPFFTAARIGVSMPWTVYRGRLAFSSIDIDGGRVLIARDRDGVSNLPATSGGPPPATPRRLDVRGLRIRGLDFQYTDAGNDVDVTVGGIETDWTFRDIRVFSGATGRLAFTRGIAVRYGGTRTASGPVEGRGSFDGSTVTLQQVALPFPEATVSLDGRVVRVLDAPSMELDLTGTADLADAVKWAPPPMAVSGTATIEGRINGPFTGFVLESRVRSDGVAIGRGRGIAMDATTRVTLDDLTVERFALGRDGATVEGQVQLGFGDEGRLALDASWQALDLDLALAIADLDPLPLGATIAGTVRVTRGPGDDAPVDMRATNTSRPLARGGRVPVAGTATWIYRGGRWEATHDHLAFGDVRVSGTQSGVAPGGTLSGAPMGGPLSIAIPDVSAALRAARAAGFAVPSLPGLEGPLAVDVQTGGTTTSPTASGTLRSADLRLAGAAATFEADLEASTAGAQVTNLSLRGAGTAVTGDAAIVLPTERLSGSLRAQVDDLVALLSVVGGAPEVSGNGEVSVTLGGTAGDPDIGVVGAFRDLAYLEQRADRLDVNGRLAGTTVRVEQLTLVEGDGRLEGTAEYDWRRETYRASLRGNGLRWVRPFGEGPDRARSLAIETLSFDGAGTIATPGGSGAAAFVFDGGRAGAVIGRGSAKVTFVSGLAQVNVFVPSLRALVTAQVSPHAPFEYTGVLVANDVAVDPLAGLAGIAPEALGGTASLSAAFQGNAWEPGRTEVLVNVQDVSLTASGVPVRLAAPVRLAWRGGALQAEELVLQIGGGELRASGRVASRTEGAWAASFRGPVADLVTAAKGFGVPAAVEAAGDVAFDWRTSGGLEGSTASLTWSDGRLRWAALPAIEQLRMTAAFDGRTIDVSGLTGRWQDGGIEGTARLPLTLFTGSAPPGSEPPEGHARVRVDGLTTAALAPWVAAESLRRMSGRLSGTLEADILTPSFAGVRGSLLFDEATLLLNGVPFEQGRPSRLTLADGRLGLEDVQWVAGGSPLILTGSVGLADGMASSLDVRVEGAADLRAVAAAVPDVATDGIASLDVTIAGTLAAPALGGIVTLEDAEIAIANPRIVVSDVSGPIRLDGTAINIPELQGSINGGRITMVGVLTLDGASLGGGELVAQVQGAVFEVPAGLQSEVDALLRFLPDATAPRLTGDVLVQRSAYRANISIPGLLRRNRTPVRTAGSRTFADRLRLDIAVESVEDLSVDNNYGRMEAGLDLRVTGTPNRPGLTGRVALREGGQLFLLGQRYRLEPSAITFTDPSKIVPDLNIQTITQVRGRTVTLTLTGPLDELETNVRSNDPNETTESLASVLVGQDLGGEDALAMLSSEILGTTGRALGLDTMRVEQGFSEDDIRQDPGLIAQEADPSSRLTLSKRIRSDIEIILSQSLRESGGLSVVFAYRPIRSLELRTVSRDNGNRSYALRHEITFGGGGPEAAGREAAPPPTVSRVDIAAAPQEDVEALRALLEVKAGDRFEFPAWQDDVDRLRKWYHQRGYFEARVRTNRSVDQAAHTTALTYRITPGPKTTLTMEGLELQPDLRAELEEAWTQSVFERFLLEDMQRRVQRHLLKRDLLFSLVEAAVVPGGAAAKTIRIAVTPGVRIAGRDLVFEGQRAVDQRRLRQELEAAGLSLDGWLVPARIEAPLEILYASLGYLNASVTAADPELVGNRGVLRVRVDEGLPFTIASVRYQGVDDERAGPVARATQLEIGGPYTLEDVELASERIVEVYHTAGFGSVDVQLRPVVDPAAYVTNLTFVVEPGPQQVLAEVETRGASRTHAGVVENALRLETGEPVNLREWAQARKRLYDTNVFRQVDLRSVPMGIPAEDGRQQVRAVVDVVEWPAWTFRYGLQLNDDRPGEDPTSPRASTEGLGDRQLTTAVIADLQNRNLFGRAVSAGAYTRVETERRTASTYLTFPTLFGSRLRTNLFGFTSQEDVPFDSRTLRLAKTGFTAEQRIRRAREWEFVYGYRLEWDHLFELDPDAEDPFPIDVRTLLGRFTVSAFVDRRVNRFNPQGGWFGAATLERLSEFESQTDFVKMLLTQYRYLKAGPLLLAGAARVGTSVLGDPLRSEAFYTGGATTVRGYAEDSLGPVDVAGLPRGGTSLLVLNGEVRVPVYGWVNAVGFVDAGNVFEEQNPFRFGDLAIGYGAGLRLDSPVGLLRVDVGFPRDRRPGDRSARWYFGIGQVF